MISPTVSGPEDFSAPVEGNLSRKRDTDNYPNSTCVNLPVPPRLSPSHISDHSHTDASHHLSPSRTSHHSHASATSATSYFELPSTLPPDIVLELAKSTAGKCDNTKRCQFVCCF